jgi:hypothetical protein
MGGSKEDRHEPGLEHWSLAVKDGKALEQEWRSEIPVPRGGPHRFVDLPSHDIYSCHFSFIREIARRLISFWTIDISP